MALDHELYALLVVYQLLRTAMVDVTDAQPERSNSKHQAYGSNIDRDGYEATISIDIITKP